MKTESFNSKAATARNQFLISVTRGPATGADGKINRAESVCDHLKKALSAFFLCIKKYSDNFKAIIRLASSTFRTLDGRRFNFF